MKLGRISAPTPDGDLARLVGLTADDKVVDLAASYGQVLRSRGASDSAARRFALALFPPSMSAAIGGGDAFLDAARTAMDHADGEGVDAASVKWIAAVDAPVIRDSLTYPTHMENFLRKVVSAKPEPQAFKTPPYFKGSVSRIYGTGEVIAYPSFTEFLDWEFEIGIIAGRQGSNMTLDQGAAAIFGYTIFNDFSARDVQPNEMKMGMGPQKSKDFAYGVGPIIVTADELPSIEGLKGKVVLNSEVVSEVESDKSTFSPAELLAWVSVSDTLLPGDLVATGTMGFGSGLEIDRKLAPGDVLELQLDKVGTLKSVIGDVEKAPYWPEEKPYAWDENGNRVAYK